MASIQKKNNTAYIVYDSYDNPEHKRRQVWDPVPDDKTPDVALLEFTLRQKQGKVVTRSNRTFKDLFSDFYLLHAQNTRHQNGTYASNCGIILNHILPHIGDVVVQKFDKRQYDLFFNLLDRKVRKSYKEGVAVIESPILAKRDNAKCLSPSTLKKTKNLMNLAFRYAKGWNYIDEIPECSMRFKLDAPEARIWEADTMRSVLEKMENNDPLLCLATHIAFIGSLRSGEALGITLDNIDLDDDTFYIGQTIQRVTKKSLNDLSHDAIIKVFPPKFEDKNSVLILKYPKTASSKRKLFMTAPLKDAIQKRIREIETRKETLGPLYGDHNLLFALPDGSPIEPKLLNYWFLNWQKENPQRARIPFHGLRHSSTSYKLMVSGGNIKAVQGETGHATAQMVTDRYAHITESPRKNMINKINSEFYAGRSKPESAINELLSIIKQDPDMLKSLVLAAMG